MKTSKLLILVSGLIVVLSTALFGIWIPQLNTKIGNIQAEINNVSDQINIFLYNTNHQGQQLTKIASTHDVHTILKELNSTYETRFENHLRAEYYQFIASMNNGKINTKELSKLNLTELDEFADRKAQKYIKENNHLFDIMKQLSQDLQTQIKKRDNWNVGIVAVQVIGLLIGIVGGYLNR